MCSCCCSNAAGFVVQFDVSAGVRRKDSLVNTGSGVAKKPRTSGVSLGGAHPEWILGYYVYLSREKSRGLCFFFLRIYSANNFLGAVELFGRSQEQHAAL